MSKQILFIQGGDDKGYEADIKLAHSLKASLGKDYDVIYPELHNEKKEGDFGWPRQIGDAIDQINTNLILVGHSLGASMILKYLSENNIDDKIDGIFLLATPFWSGNEDWKSELKLNNDFADKLPANIPISFYQCKDDDTVTIQQFQEYKQRVPHAVFHEIEKGGHQFDDDLAFLGDDIRKL